MPSSEPSPGMVSARLAPPSVCRRTAKAERSLLARRFDAAIQFAARHRPWLCCEWPSSRCFSFRVARALILLLHVIRDFAQFPRMAVRIASPVQ